MLLMLLAACADGDDGPAITIVSPSEGDTVCGDPLEVLVEVTGITLVEPFPDSGTPVEPGTGHVDAALNGQEEDDWMFSGEQIVMPGVEDGEYQLRVELSNADHTPLQPYAGDLIYITVAASACG